MPKETVGEKIMEILLAIFSVIAAIVMFFLNLLWAIVKGIASAIVGFVKAVLGDVHNRAVQFVGGILFLALMGWLVSLMK